MASQTEYEADLEALRREMDCAPATLAEMAEHRLALSVVDLMSATQALSDLALADEPMVRREAGDIELAYQKLGRMLARIRRPELRVVG